MCDLLEVCALSIPNQIVSMSRRREKAGTYADTNGRERGREFVHWFYFFAFSLPFSLRRLYDGGGIDREEVSTEREDLVVRLGMGE